MISTYTNATINVCMRVYVCIINDKKIVVLVRAPARNTKETVASAMTQINVDYSRYLATAYHQRQCNEMRRASTFNSRVNWKAFEGNENFTRGTLTLYSNYVYIAHIKYVDVRPLDTVGKRKCINVCARYFSRLSVYWM